MTRSFNANDLLKKVNYPVVDLYFQKKAQSKDTIMTVYIFYFWIIMFSVQRAFPDFYREILNSFLKILWNRGKLMKIHKSLENFKLVVNSDFNRYEIAISDKNDPVFNLCKVFFNYLFNKEVMDIRAIIHIASYFYENSKAYNKIFSEIELI